PPPPPYGMLTMDSPSEFGTILEQIAVAEQQLGVTFPDVLKQVWLLANIIDVELPGGWRLLRIFDEKNPRKTTYRSIVHENTVGKGRWSYMPEGLIAIAQNDEGNCLVLRKGSDGSLSDEVLVWIHDSSRMRKWGKPLNYIFEKARTRVAQITNARARGLHHSQHDRSRNPSKASSIQFEEVDGLIYLKAGGEHKRPESNTSRQYPAKLIYVAAGFFWLVCSLVLACMRMMSGNAFFSTSAWVSSDRFTFFIILTAALSLINFFIYWRSIH
ncbi:MAG: SMI1/KNR4 family protein, partial [Armatimonadota bacterium]